MKPADHARPDYAAHQPGYWWRSPANQHQANTFHGGDVQTHALALWVANYRYRERLFQVLVNGRTGRVAGDRPWSWWKIARLVLLIIFAILLVLILVNKAKGHSTNRRAEPRRLAVEVAQGGMGLDSGVDGNSVGRQIRYGVHYEAGLHHPIFQPCFRPASRPGYIAGP